MKNSKQLWEQLQKFNATISNFMTTEAWADKTGHIFYVDRTPIQWDKVGKQKDTEVTK